MLHLTVFYQCRRSQTITLPDHNIWLCSRRFMWCYRALFDFLILYKLRGVGIKYLEHLNLNYINKTIIALYNKELKTFCFHFLHKNITLNSDFMTPKIIWLMTKINQIHKLLKILWSMLM